MILQKYSGQLVKYIRARQKRAPAAPKQAQMLRTKFPSRIRLHRDFFDIAPEIQLECYWKSANGDQGPGAVVYILGRPVLKFDCFGHPKGHFHANIDSSTVKPSERQNRIHMPEHTMHDQVCRCAFEVRWNLRYYMNRHPSQQVQQFPLDRDHAKKVADLMENLLLEYCKHMPSRFGSAVVEGTIRESQAWSEREREFAVRRSTN